MYLPKVAAQVIGAPGQALAKPKSGGFPTAGWCNVYTRSGCPQPSLGQGASPRPGGLMYLPKVAAQVIGAPGQALAKPKSEGFPHGGVF